MNDQHYNRIAEYNHGIISPVTKGHTTVLIQGITDVNGINPPGQHTTLGNKSVLANANGICFAH